MKYSRRWFKDIATPQKSVGHLGQSHCVTLFPSKSDVRGNFIPAAPELQLFTQLWRKCVFTSPLFYIFHKKRK